MSVMLYSHPGQHEMHGDKFDYIIVDEKQVKEAIQKGWCKTTPEAKEKYEKVMAKKNAKPPVKPEQVVAKPEKEDDPVDVAAPEAKDATSSLASDNAKTSE